MEQKEFEILSMKIRPKLLLLVRNFAVDAGLEADDIVQETFIALWKLIQEGYPVRNAEMLAVKIAKNICVGYYRKARVDTERLVDNNYQGGIEATILTDNEDVEKIKRFIYASLSETQKEYLYMRNDRGLSLDEIATLTGKPKTSIKSAISKARRQMLDLIRGQI